MKTITFFNNKGGVGKTTLAYHVSWMLKEMGMNTLSIDLDPQANLTGMFMSEDKIEKFMEEKKSLYSAMEPLIKGRGDIGSPNVFRAEEGLALLLGDLKLSSVEAELSGAWPKCLDKEERAFRVTTAFSRLIRQAGEDMSAKWGIIDIGPNLGAINRAVLIASDYVVFPLGPDLFSYQGLRNVGEFLKTWRKEWRERKQKKPAELDFPLPEGNMLPLGYIMMRHSIRHDRPVKAYQKWMDRMPTAYRQNVLEESRDSGDHLLAHLKDYRSLMPMAQEHTKPMFLLKPGDGAIGAHFQAVQACYKDFKDLTEKLLSLINNRP